ncbi:ABC transporter ATP-binding protein [Limnochorda pilosa]|uniref:Peptide ABC transporter ATPase n=1 Tax=Limnochorda pilosa TaxID=1555112 RepID=A0A0K2SI89_LIMPI|nr:ABC transporter ATP-binding protein [Limnochorda pilosa]BAS26800.1 peptide ABC transporter ATPase [Limnochorda pilosa]
MSVLLEAEHISASYLLDEAGARETPPCIRAVDDVSLELHEGEVIGIAGESGCGKSTLAMVLSGTVRPPLQVTAGRLRIAEQAVPLAGGGSDPRAASDADQTPLLRGRVVAMLPQGAMNALNPTLRIRDFVFDVLRSHLPGITRQEAIERASERLERLGLPPRVLSAYPHQLSGGMKQRVVAVVSTLLDPDVLVADEPTSALDVTSQRMLLALLVSFLEQSIIRGIVFITHELPLLRYIAQRIAIMYAGQLVEVGPTDRVLFAPSHPYTQALMHATIVLEKGTRRQRIKTVGGAPPGLLSPPPGCRFHPRCPVAMPICSQSVPPAVSVGERHDAACWWVAGHSAGEAGATHDAARR